MTSTTSDKPPTEREEGENRPISEFLRYSVGTDIGLKRNENQDSYGIIEKGSARIFLVADGMGGVKGGAIASRTAIDAVERCLLSASTLNKDDIVSAITIANAEILSKAVKDPSLSGMGTTITGIVFTDHKMLVVNVGDSRVYRIRKNDIVQLTDDHTLVNDLIKSGAITIEQAQNHPVAHMLTRSLGPAPDIVVDCIEINDGPAAGDRYVICSDGLYNVVSDDEIKTICATSSINDAIQILIDRANEEGGPDNITVIIVEVDTSYPKKPEDFPTIRYKRLESSKLEAERDHEAIVPMRSTSSLQEIHAHHDDAEKGDRIERDKTSAEDSGTVSILANKVHILFSILGLIVIFVGFQMYHSNLYNTYLQINPLALKFAYPPLTHNNSPPVLVSSPYIVKETRLAVPSSGLQPTNAPIKDRITHSQYSALIQRKQSHQERIDELSHLITALEHYTDPLLKSKLSKLTDTQHQLELNAKRINNEINEKSRELISLIEKSKRLKNGDPIDLASEVAFTSTLVKEKKELFENATWAYLNKVEEWKFNPNNKSLAEKVKQLGKARELRRKELAKAVKEAILNKKEEVEDQLANLSVSLNMIREKIQRNKRYSDILKKALTASKKEKEAIIAELRKELNDLKNELFEISQMLK